MKILWLSPMPVTSNNNSYNGGGWINSLLNNLSSEKNDIAVAFLGVNDTYRVQVNNITTYSIKEKKLSSLEKISYYWYGYKHISDDIYEQQVQNIIKDFNPDIIHIWGVESKLAFMIGRTDIPLVVHIQGLLSPCSLSFFPQGLSQSWIKQSSFIRERIFRNGYDFAYKSFKLRAQIEEIRMQNITYAMGRTHWDRELVKLYSPSSTYYHVNETIRESFYSCEKIYNHDDKFIITSTISQTIYKGLDVILRAADILKRLSNVDFEWRVVGIDANSNFVKLFEGHTNIDSNDVNISYLGILNEDLLSSNLRETSVYVHPSYIDNSPNSLCEAQLVGLANIACNVGGVASLIDHGITGYLVPSNAPHEIAYYLRTLAEDIEQMVSMGAASRSIALKRHNKNTIIRSLMDVYNDIYNKSKK